MPAGFFGCYSLAGEAFPFSKVEPFWPFPSHYSLSHFGKCFIENSYSRAGYDKTGNILGFQGRLDSPICEDPYDLVSIQRLFLSSWLQSGKDFYLLLSGDLSCAYYVNSQNLLFLFRDYPGIKNLYYSIQNGVLFFSSTLDFMKIFMAKEDDYYLSSLMLTGCAQLPDSHTLFKGVFKLKPGELVTLGAGAIKHETVFSLSPKDKLLSDDEVQQGFLHYFEQAVKRRLKGSSHAGVEVSGGLDSSSVYSQSILLAREMNMNVTGFHVNANHVEAAEEYYVCTLERKYGVKVQRIPAVICSDWNEMMESCIYSHTPVPDPQWRVTKSVYTEAGSCGCTCLLSGLFGDQVLYNRAYLPKLLKSAKIKLLKKHLGREHFGKELFALIKLVVKEGLKHKFSLISNRRNYLTRHGYKPYLLFQEQVEGLRIPLWEEGFGPCLKQEIESEYTSFCLGWNDHVSMKFRTRVSYPFLDRDFLQFLSGLKGEQVAIHGIKKGLLKRALTGILPEEIVMRKDKGDYTAFVWKQMEELYKDKPYLKWIQRILSERGISDCDTLSRLFTRIGSEIQYADASLCWQLLELAGLAFWYNEQVNLDEEI
jgi:asparagine synthase (glutamine-hydrolysing)